MKPLDFISVSELSRLIKNKEVSTKEMIESDPALKDLIAQKGLPQRFGSKST